MLEKQTDHSEILELHKYEVTLATGTRIISFPYIKTSAILKIFLGTSGEFRELIKSIFNQQTLEGNKIEIDKIMVLNKALDMLNITFAGSIVDAFTEVVDTALDEYDTQGNIAVRGNCKMMSPEDVNAIFRVILLDIGEVLKNVLGIEAKKIVKRGRKPLSLIKEPETEKIPEAVEQ